MVLPLIIHILLLPVEGIACKVAKMEKVSWIKKGMTHMEFVFCPLCGERLGHRELGDEGMVPWCERCDRPFFPFSYPCVIIAPVNEHGQIALIKQNYVSTENWVLVAGYVKVGETVECAVGREVMEETGLTVDRSHYLGSYHHPKGDAIMLSYMAEVKKTQFGRSKEVDDIAWFTMEEAATRLRSGSIAQKVFIAARELQAAGPR